MSDNFEELLEEKRHKEILNVLKEILSTSKKDDVSGELLLLNSNYRKLVEVLSNNSTDEVNSKLVSSITSKIDALILKLSTESKKEFEFTIERDPYTDNIIKINAKQIK